MTNRELLLKALKALSREELEEYGCLHAIVIKNLRVSNGTYTEVASSQEDGYTPEEAHRASLLTLKVREACIRIRTEGN